MPETIQLAFTLALVVGGLLFVVWVISALARGAGDSHHRTGDDWLDAPGDDQGTGWTNFDYIAASEMEDIWSSDE